MLTERRNVEVVNYRAQTVLFRRRTRKPKEEGGYSHNKLGNSFRRLGKKDACGRLYTKCYYTDFDGRRCRSLVVSIPEHFKRCHKRVPPNEHRHYAQMYRAQTRTDAKSLRQRRRKKEKAQRAARAATTRLNNPTPESPVVAVECEIHRRARKCRTACVGPAGRSLD